LGKTAEFSKRGSKKGDTRRMRIYSLHDDQVDLIKTALAKARKEGETEYDSVALTYICMDFIATPSNPEFKSHSLPDEE
jgi:hypothetical protein